MDEEKSELEQAWDELQETPAYVERFTGTLPRLVIVEHCPHCGNWHNADEPGCPVLVEV